tara:strand:+ start:2938 stop:3279 length:342 start_codon:yes stop_codon:yes gene_type:complete
MPKLIGKYGFVPERQPCNIRIPNRTPIIYLITALNSPRRFLLYGENFYRYGQLGSSILFFDDIFLKLDILNNHSAVFIIPAATLNGTHQVQVKNVNYPQTLVSNIVSISYEDQ